MKKIIIVALLSITPISVLAGVDGALLGLGDALSDISNRMQQQKYAEQQMRLNQQMEIEREQRSYEYQLMQRRQQEEYNRQEAEKRIVDNDKAVEVYKRQQMQVIEMHHPDWRKIAEGKAFNDWIVMLPFETKNTLKTTWDGVFISETISAFKEYEAKNKKRHNKRKTP